MHNKKSNQLQALFISSIDPIHYMDFRKEEL